MEDIPAHTRCINCGDCCGIVPASIEEVDKILAVLVESPELLQSVIVRQANSFEICPFRNEEQTRCDVYDVRPLICRLMGVCDIMPCKQGNSTLIDPHLYMQDRDNSDVVILNIQKWEDLVGRYMQG